MTEERIGRRAIVRGEVQGVGFRMNARERARELGVSGVARNLPDGSVEVLVEGDAAAVNAMLEWLQHGPQYARVDSVEVTEHPPTGEAGFQVE
ncbi:acylphosphatase [Planctomonas psychrotolerans]|uniref:acylphosphatase n=1 Tax=Planctomonas psychrotolerans TaxID=2528712 RepID=UPI00123C5FF2|nr:acylphosphatase [Planctomonas psychrotolerans]